MLKNRYYLLGDHGSTPFVLRPVSLWNLP